MDTTVLSHLHKKDNCTCYSLHSFFVVVVSLFICLQKSQVLLTESPLIISHVCVFSVLLLLVLMPVKLPLLKFAI